MLRKCEIRFKNQKLAGKQEDDAPSEKKTGDYSVSNQYGGV